MELWIRSQDKLRLFKIKNVMISAIKSEQNKIICNYEEDFEGYETSIPLGTYKTKERALEVLDEIQAVIMVNGLLPCELKQELNKRNIDLNDRAIFNIKTNKCLYIMPQE